MRTNILVQQVVAFVWLLTCTSLLATALTINDGLARNPILVLHNVKIPHLIDIQRIIPRFSTVSISQRHDEALAVASQLGKFSDELLLLGASTVKNEHQAKSLVENGAKFLSTTNYLHDVWEYCQHNDIPLTCGVQTIKECEEAVLNQVNFYKIFPIQFLSPVQVQQMVYTIRSKRPSAKIVAAGGIKLSDLSMLKDYGFDNIAVGYDLLQYSVHQVSDDFQTFCDRWHYLQQHSENIQPLPEPIAGQRAVTSPS